MSPGHHRYQLAADTISAAHAFPTSITCTQTFLEFVKFANEAGKGVFEIKVRGWHGSALQFHLWSVREPKLDAQGALDVSGFKARGNPLYNAFFTNYLKAQVNNVNVPEVYTALERGIKIVKQSPEAGKRYIQAAADEKLKRMKDRLEKSGSTRGMDEIVSRFIVAK